VAPLSAWQAVGYRPSKLTSAWNTIVAAYAAAFPSQQLIEQTGSWGFPPIDNNGAIVAGSSGDTAEAQTLYQSGVQIAGSSYALLNTGLSVHWVFPKPAVVPASTPLAFSPGTYITGDSSCTANNHITPCDPVTVMTEILANATAADAEFVELFVVDLQNPALAGPIAGYGG
jgi:hypothetical protein